MFRLCICVAAVGLTGFLNPLRGEDGGRAASKPVLLMGTGYGDYERAAWVRRILSPDGLAFESTEKWREPSEWGDFSAVIIAESSPSVLTAESAGQMLRYLEDGGAVILTGGGLASLSGSRTVVPEWFPAFGKSRIKAMSLPTKVEVVAEPGWEFAGIVEKWGVPVSGLSPPAGEFRMGSEHDSMVSVVRVGRGFIAYIGATFFRIENAAALADASPRLPKLRSILERTTEPNERQDLVQKVKSFEERLAGLEKLGVPDMPAVEGLLSAILAKASPLSTTKASAPWIKSHVREEAVFWQRDPVISKEIYGYRQSAPGPAWHPAEPGPEETVKSLGIHAGINDALGVGVNVTAAVPLSGLQAGWVPSGPNGPQVQVLQAGIMARPDAANPPGVAGDGFWLRPANGPLAPGETTLLMLVIRTGSAEAGTYSGSLNVTWPGGSRSLPVSLVVHPVRFDETKALELGFYGFNWLGPFPRDVALIGQSKPASLNVAGALPILANQRSLGASGVVDGTMELNQTRIAGDTKTLGDYTRGQTRPDLFDADGKLRKLDFGGYTEAVVAARNLGYSRVNIRHGMSVLVKPSSNYVTLLTGEPHLSPLWGKVFSGIWAQFREYLAGQGFTQFTFKIGDELSTESIKQGWMPVAALAADAGWLPETNPTGEAVEPGTLKLIGPLCRSYSVNVHFVDEVLKWKRDGEFRPADGSRIGEYGSWGYYKSPAVLMRRACWEAWAKGLVGLDVYTYARLFLFDGKTVFNPSSAIGLMTGWNETSFLTQLAAARAEAVRAGRDDAWVKESGRFLDGLRSGGEGFVWKEERPGTFPFPVRTLEVTTSELDRKREDLFRLLAARPKL
jgi:hypothetical protein